MKIESDIPIPETARKREWQFIDDMRPGDSVLIHQDEKTYKAVSRARDRFKKEGVTLVLRQEGEAVRVWLKEREREPARPVRFLVDFECENAAFEPIDGQLPWWNRHQEVTLILRKLADSVVDGDTSGPILDSGGNTVGHFRFTDA